MREENNFTYRSKLKLILQKLVKIFGFVEKSKKIKQNFESSLLVLKHYVIYFLQVFILNYRI